MFDTRQADDRLHLIGRLDAAQVDRARDAMNRLTVSCVVDFGELEYISSAGLGLLLGTQKRLGEQGNSLKLINMNRHIRELFRMAGFDRVFDIE
jgi:anti-sigma B factor antagonist